MLGKALQNVLLEMLVVLDLTKDSLTKGQFLVWYPLMSRNARNKMPGTFNKRNEVSPRLSRKIHHHCWQKIRRIKVIECALNCSPQGDVNSNPTPNLKDNPNTNANPKVTTWWFTLRLSETLSGTLRDVDQNWACVQLRNCWYNRSELSKLYSINI